MAAGADKQLVRLLGTRSSTVPVIWSLKLLRVLAGCDEDGEGRNVPDGAIKAVVAVLEASKSPEVLEVAVAYLYELVEDGARACLLLRRCCGWRRIPRDPWCVVAHARVRAGGAEGYQEDAASAGAGAALAALITGDAASHETIGLAIEVLSTMPLLDGAYESWREQLKGVRNRASPIVCSGL